MPGLQIQQMSYSVRVCLFFGVILWEDTEKAEFVGVAPFSLHIDSMYLDIVGSDFKEAFEVPMSRFEFMCSQILCPSQLYCGRVVSGQLTQTKHADTHS